MEKNKEYFERQIKGLIILLSKSKDSGVARNYILEKLKMMLTDGVNFHSSIIKRLDKE